MSLEGSYSSDIVVPRTQLSAVQGILKDSPCLEILRLAMEKAARDHGGKLDNQYLDNAGANHACILALHTREFPRGVGATLEPGGRILFRFETLGDNRGIGQALSSEVNQNYNVIAVARAQKRLGFNIQMTEKTSSSGQRIVTVTGVR